LTHDSDSCGYYHGYQVAEPVFSMSLHLAISFLLDKRAAPSPLKPYLADRSRQAVHISQSLNVPAIVFYRVSFD
jgi:hypothetical protein